MSNGEADEFVHPLHATRMADAFIRAVKRFDMLFIPGAGHELATGGTSTASSSRTSPSSCWMIAETPQTA